MPAKASAFKSSRSCGTREGSSMWVNLDICGLVGGALTWMLLMYGSVATTSYVILPWMKDTLVGYLNVFFFNLAVCIAIYSHVKTMITDPGAVPNSAMPLLSDQTEADYEASQQVMNGLDKYKKTCRRCVAFKPVRAHHCSVCGRCVVKMDHHCPWVNNCVGIGNHKLFITFLFWTNVVCTYSLTLQAGRLVACVYGSTARDEKCSDFGMNMGIMMLFMESVLFYMFTTCMLADQAAGAITNQTQIERLKKERHDTGVEFNEVFGSGPGTRFQLHWIVPIPVSFPASIRDRLFGYRLPGEDEEAEDEETEELVSAKGASQLDARASEQLAGSAPVDAEMGSASDPVTVSGRYEALPNGSVRKRSGPP